MRNPSASSLIFTGTLLLCGAAHAQSAAGEAAPTPTQEAPAEAASAAATDTAAAEQAAAPAPDSAASTAPAAEEEPPLQAIPEKMNLQVPVAPPPVERTYRVHRGFYLGVNAGIGFNSGSYDDNDPSGDSVQGSGFNLPMDLLVGYAASPGLAVGGALMMDFLPSGHFTRDGFSQDDSSASLLLGPFVDGFPNEKGPLHVGGTIGLAHIATKDIDVKATGLGFAAWVGYVPWVSDHFSIGASLRVMANFTGINKDISASTNSLNLVLDALYF